MSSAESIAKWRQVLHCLAMAMVFCAPLFIGLGSSDLRHDEDIYSFAVELMVENGDFLTPRSIPSESAPFFEKPPLKFWIVAASIRAGLLPDNEFGHRFWDAVFGSLAFLYVFAIGRRLRGSLCGAVAVLVLFVHEPLLSEHGLRSNTMEAALVLSYCGAIHHMLAWSVAASHWRRRLHPVAAGAFFTLGFMTKFAAALFLPAIIAAALVLMPRWRSRVFQDWRIWAVVLLLCAVATVPWFAIQTLRHGSSFWNVILGEHVYQRMTTFLDPDHVKPWHYYFGALYAETTRNGSALWIGAGFLVLVVQTIRQRSETGILILLWFALPLVAISIATSKLYHYVYPFLPPLALAAGYLPALLASPESRLVQILLKYESRLYDVLKSYWRGIRVPVLSSILAGFALAAAGVAIATALVGPVDITFGEVRVFKNSSVARPLVMALLILVISGQWVTLVRGGLLLLVLSLPLSAHLNAVRHLADDVGPMRRLRDCLLGLMPPGAGPGVYAHTADLGTWRYVYYFRRVGLNNSAAGDSGALAERLFVPERHAPVLLSSEDYSRFLEAVADGRITAPAGSRADRFRPSQVKVMEVARGDLVLLPGRFGVCATAPNISNLR